MRRVYRVLRSAAGGRRRKLNPPEANKNQNVKCKIVEPLRGDKINKKDGRTGGRNSKITHLKMIDFRGRISY